jgi:hypothetical protein
MKDSKYNIGDLVAVYVELDDVNDKLLLGWIVSKNKYVTIDNKITWIYDIEWADGELEDEVEESVVYNVIKAYREAKRYKRWTRSRWI